MLSGRLPLLVVAALVASAAALTEARAAPLDAEACTKLQAEHGELERTGVEKDMENGPDWAKANLGVEKMQRVQRYIELEELLLFRCRSKALVHLSPEREWTTDQDSDDNDADKETAPNAGKAGEAQSDEPKQKPDAGKAKAPQPAAKPAGAKATRAPPAKSAAGDPAEPGVTSIEKRSPPRAKVDDAYKAPPPDPSVDPFATQVNPR
jgi:hypothetical protein